MKQNIMKKWVKALRSGKYKQGQGVLKQTTSKNVTYHCCLGVLCELYNEDMKNKKKKTLKETRYNGIHRLDKESEHLPSKVQKWAGLSGRVGQFKDYDHNKILNPNVYSSLADMNDMGCKFKTIANTIEKRWENI